MNYEERYRKTQEVCKELREFKGEEKAQTTLDKLAAEIVAEHPTAYMLQQKDFFRVVKTAEKTMFVKCPPDFWDYYNRYLPELNRLLQNKFAGYSIKWAEL